MLTLSATPIPRTLHMSLLGIRDISNLETPPPDRKAIETRVCRFDREVIKRAIHRELNRDGQIYFVHNRVYDITTIADCIQSIVPEARIGIAHGQMSGEELERTMMSFISRKFDILVATTIIESGLDIPNVNTIFINEADKYGLADLHQLRGRVGRYKHRAYAYLMLESDRPVTPNAVKRLKAIEEFTRSGPGSRSRFATSKSAAPATSWVPSSPATSRASATSSIARCWKRPPAALTNQPDRPLFDCSVELKWRAYLPRDYVTSPRIKLELYRRIGRLRSLNHLSDLRQEMIDRFGPLPRPAETLLLETEIRILAGAWKVDRIHVEAGQYIVLTYSDSARIEALARRHPGSVRIVDAKKAYVPLGDDPVKTPEIAQRLLSLLRT